MNDKFQWNEIGKVSSAMDLELYLANREYNHGDYCHYTSLEIIDKILKNNEFWLSCVDNFNDVRDSEQFAKDELKNYYALCFATGLGTQANYWTCVYEEDFDAAMKLMFGSKEAREAYPGLIEKIKHYREKVTSQGDALYKKFAEEYGVEIGTLAKYGYMNMPISYSANEPSDALVSLEDGSLGATVAPIGKTLSSAYLASADPKYVSADKMVDTSTCLFPETTWIIKNAHHNFFELDDVIAQAFFFDNATIDNDLGLPQFMRFYEDTRSYEPMTEDNCGDYEWYSIAEAKPTTESILVSMMRWFRMIFEIITQILKGEFEIGNIIKK